MVDFVHKYFPVTIEQEKIELPPPPTQKAPSISIYKSDMTNDELPFPDVPTLESVVFLFCLYISQIMKNYIMNV